MSRSAALLLLALFGLLFCVSDSDALRHKPAQSESHVKADEIRRKISEAKAKHTLKTAEQYSQTVAKIEQDARSAAHARGRAAARK